MCKGNINTLCSEGAANRRTNPLAATRTRNESNFPRQISKLHCALYSKSRVLESVTGDVWSCQEIQKWFVYSIAVAIRRPTAVVSGNWAERKPGSSAEKT
jgi:hypothetical protein